MDIKDSQVQLTLDLDAGLTQRFSSLREVVAAGTYRRGLKRVAGDLDLAPGNLSVALSGEGTRHFDLDWLERYISTSGDKTPIYFLIARYCQDQSVDREEALERVQSMLGDLTQALASAGLNRRTKR